MADKALSAICKNTKEIIFTEPLDESEILAIMSFCKAKKIGCTFTQSKRLFLDYLHLFKNWKNSK